MSRDSRFICGLTLILVPTIVYGGLTLLGVLTGGSLFSGSERSDQLSVRWIQEIVLVQIS
jgi:hypothetical protein